GAFAGAKHISEPTRRGRRAGCFADSNADTGKEQHRVGGGEAGGRRHRGPYDDSPGQELFAACGISDAPEWHAENGIDPNEGAAEKPDLAVAEGEPLAHGFGGGAGGGGLVKMR